MIIREHYLEKISAGFKFNPIVVLIGARQVGKTTLMLQYTANLKALWLNGQDPENAHLFDQFSSIERFLQININEELNGWLVIDEFQYINSISIMMKLLVDKYKNLKILCSGSSSLDILQKTEESLAGRLRVIPVYSLSFSEYLNFYNEDLFSKYLKFNLNDDLNLFIPQMSLVLKEYLSFGGLPKIALAHQDNEKEGLLEDILSTYLLKDVRQYVRNQDFVAFNKLLKLLASQIGNMVNINELSNTIQLPYRVCEEYVYILEQMYIIHLVNPYSTNKRNEISKMKKIFFCDLGLRNIIYNSFNEMDIRTDNGQLFENYVYLELLKSTDPKHIYYYRTKDGTEIDFIVTDKTNKMLLIEVKYKKFEQAKKIRALSSLAFDKANVQSFIINLNCIGSIDNQKYVLPYVINQLVN